MDEMNGRGGAVPAALFAAPGEPGDLVVPDDMLGTGKTRTGLITIRPDQMYAVVEMVTPQHAQMILDEANLGTETLRQRKLSEANVVDQMGWQERGEWRPVPPGIVYDVNNRLLNGQHGLWAQVRTGLTLPWWITRNCLPEIFPFIDTGKKRTVADALYMNMMIEQSGMGGHLGSALRLMCCYEEYQNGLYQESWADWCKRRLSHTQILAVLSRRPNMGESLQMASRLVQLREGYNRAALTVFHRLVLDRYPKDAPHLEDFIERLATGRRTESGDPADALRGWRGRGMPTAGGDNHRTTRERALFGILLAWNKFAAGEPMKQIRFKAGDPMPEPRGMRKLSTKTGSGGRS